MAVADLIFISSMVGLIGAIMLSRSFLFKSMQIVLKETSTFLGFNPFMIKSSIQQLCDSRIGMFFYVAGVLLASYAAVLSLKPHKAQSMVFSSNSSFAIAVVLSLVLLCFVFWLSDQVSEVQASTILKPKMKELYNQAIFIINNDGRDEKMVRANACLTPEQKAGNIKSSAESLNQIRSLFDRKTNEELRVFFES